MIMGFEHDVCDSRTRVRTDDFSLVVRDYRTMLLRYVEARLLCPADADDIVQEVLIIAYHRQLAFDHNRDLGAWLRGIAKNRIMKYNARVKRRANTFEQLGLALIEQEAKTHETHTGDQEQQQLDTLQQLLENMPIRMQTVLNGWLARKRAMEMAAELNLSVANVHQIQHRAIKLMRVGLEKAMAQ